MQVKVTFFRRHASGKTVRYIDSKMLKMECQANTIKSIMNDVNRSTAFSYNNPGLLILLKLKSKFSWRFKKMKIKTFPN